MVGVQELGCRVFEYTRGDNFKIEVVVKGSEFHCFAKQTIPADTPEDVALLFFKEAQHAVEKKLEREYEESKYNTSDV